MLGIKRRALLGTTATLSFLGGLWLLTEIGTFISINVRNFLELHSGSYLATAIAGSILAFLVRVYEPRKVSFEIPTTQIRVTLKFSDLFDEPCDIAVAVNEFVDSEIGQRIASNSVHGQLITRWFNSEAHFRASVDSLLPKQLGVTTSRSRAPKRRYPLGTTVRVQGGGKQAYLFVLTHTDLVTDKASVSLSEAIESIRQLLVYIHQNGNGRAVAMPLIGNGLSGLNLKPQHILRLLVLLIVTVGRTSGLPNDIRICLHDDCFEHLDLREIARDWRH